MPILSLLALAIVGAPLLVLLAFLLAFPRRDSLKERTVAALVKTATGAALLAALAAAFLMLKDGVARHEVVLGDWISTPGFHLRFEFALDLHALAYAILTLVLCGVVASFSTRYLHREAGYHRFFVLFTLFLCGMMAAALADTVETLFVGWEAVGLSSVLLIAFFQDRPAPVASGLRVWVVYRLGDAALMLAALLMHAFFHSGEFLHLGAEDALRHPHVGDWHWAALGGLFLLAAGCKSALVPFSGWLPRAMEGPTTSSAIFYGAISIHLGAFLLLRIAPVLEHMPAISASVVVLGALTTLTSFLAARVQTDVKSKLAFSTLTQVGIIFVEVGCGFHTLALVHLLGHACLRTLQFLRAPNWLQDHHRLRNALGRDPEAPARPAAAPGAMGLLLYRLSVERGFLDALLDKLVARPFAAVFGRLDAFDRALARKLDGEESR